MAYPLNHFASSAIKDLTPQLTILAPLDDSQSENRAPLNPIFDGAALLSSPGVLHLRPSCGCATTRLASPPPLQSTPLHPHPGLPSPRDPPLCVLGDDLLCDFGAPSFADFQRFLLTSLQSQSTLEVFPNDTPAGIPSSTLLAQFSPPGFSTIAYANVGGHCFLGKIPMELLHLSWEKSLNLSSSERAEMLSTVDLHSCFLKTSCFGDDKCFSFHSPHAGTLVSEQWWCAPGHGDWCTCLETYILCRDGIYHKVDKPADDYG